MSRATAFNGLKAYCYNLETDSKKLRRGHYGENPDVEAAGKFVQDLSETMSKLASDASKLEELYYGSKEDKKNHVDGTQIVQRCRNLMDLNTNTMALLDSHLNKFKGWTSETTQRSKLQKKHGSLAKKQEQNVELDENDNGNDECGEEEEGDVSVLSVADFVGGSENTVSSGQEVDEVVVVKDDQVASSSSSGKLVVNEIEAQEASPISTGMKACTSNVTATSPITRALIKVDLSPVNVDGNGDDENRTPCLGDFKFSSATQGLIGSKAGMSLGADIESEESVPDNTNPSSGTSTPADIHMTAELSTIIQSPVDTPKVVTESVHAGPSNRSSPETPEAMTPLLTTSLRRTTVFDSTVHHAQETANSLETEISPQTKMKTWSPAAASVKSQGTPEMPTDFRNMSALESPLSTDTFTPPVVSVQKDDVDSDGDEPAPTISPPRIGTLLQPRGLGASTSGWIPLLKEEEFDHAPSFLRMQSSLSTLNDTLDKLNTHIATKATDNNINSRLESFTEDEIKKLCPELPNSKVVAYALVQLGKLDMGTENGIKVFKVRRYY
jgi:hypothetical protein